jgi:hypothetical protein
LLTLSAVMLLGGSLGDRYRHRRTFLAGLAVFAVASVLCALAPTAACLIGARALQGAGGAVVVPGALAIIAATFDGSDRVRVIVAWSGVAGIATAVGPFVAGGLVGAVGWRYIFWLNVPVALLGGIIARRWFPDPHAVTQRNPDLAGALLIGVALVLLCYAAIARRAALSAPVLVLAVAGFARHGLTRREPVVPRAILRSRQLAGVNVTTFAVNCALATTLFVVVLRLQVSLRYSALEAGAALLPSTVLMVALSPFAGLLGQRIGVRSPLTLGPMITAVAMLLFGRIGAGASYVGAVLPADLLFGCGMALTSAPLTAGVLGGVPDDSVVIASELNNAVARVAALFAVAVIPAVAGLDPGASVATSLGRGYVRTLEIAAGICVLGAATAFASARVTARTTAVPMPASFAASQHPMVLRAEDRATRRPRR